MEVVKRRVPVPLGDPEADPIGVEQSRDSRRQVEARVSQFHLGFLYFLFFYFFET